MRKLGFLLYGIASYLVFFGTFLYAIGFVGNWIVPKTVDSGTPGPVGLSILVNVALLGLFGLQHSVMARPAFKRWWTRFVPHEIERSTYVLLSSVCMILLFALWQPLPTALWTAEGALRMAIQALFLGGVGLVLYATMLIDHFDLFGLRQVILAWKGTAYTNHPFATPSLYRFVRHPLYVGWFVVFWATPDLTAGHLLLAAVTTAYILVAVLFEERDLVDHFGEDYVRYRETTPAFVPAPRRAERTRAAAPSH